MVTAAMKRHLLLRRKAMINVDKHYFANNGPSSQSYGFSSSHVWMWVLDCKESWVLKNRCFWTVVLVKTLESPLDCKEIQPVHPKGNQFWIFTGRTDAEAGIPILWPSNAKSWLTRKDTDPGLRLKIGGEEGDRGWDGWMASLTQWTWIWTTPGDGEGQGILVCLSPWYHKESDIMSSDWTTSSVPNYHSIRVIHLETSLFFLTKYERMVGTSSGNKFSKSLLHRNLHVKDFG